ncbi:type II secretion system protein [Wenzhouxiangella sp. AB-CW3]|uniref:type II secretion system protein n=1 Tax=Wenzhouxiangella sp. AB-CW3 TaxID=2771012 RepID=UPI00168A99C6|nr:type II secretion system protein [Wenzhouxiangella sp. AB-CW3]QOC22182.1 type II secretion system protein [Wenzhouxiangella sp. AB-CW3]
MKLTSSHPAADSRGFTLVEMAVVLAIIGLILGALAVAKDVQRNAEYNRVANKFVMQWRAAYDQYYQRTGSVVGDCQQAPTYMINGAETNFDGSGGDVCQRTSPWAGGSGAAGVPANFTDTGLRVCNGEGYPANSVGPGDPELAEQNLRDLMLRSGITLPAGRGEGFEDRYVYEDSNGNVAELQVCFQWNPPEQASGSGNVMVIRGLTPDLARYLDQLIDGQADAREGRFRIQNEGQRSDEAGGANQPGHQWAANVTHSQNHFVVDPDEPANAIATGRAFNEDEVVLLTAHWRMDQ